jgi:hypothetical protein
MSLFKSLSLRCPSCGAEQAFDAVHSVNADRRPDLRVAILNDEFQRVACANCAAPLRLDPDFTLLDQARGLWISAAPLAELGQWPALEARARDTFEETYGAGAPAGAQEIGRALKPRVTFGWAGLREKLLVAEQGLDDVAVELCKMAVMRSGAPVQLERDTELRLVAVEGDELVFAWLRSTDELPDESISVGRALYDDIAEDTAGDWAKLRDSISAGPFVDINRMLIAPSGS